MSSHRHRPPARHVPRGKPVAAAPAAAARQGPSVRRFLLRFLILAVGLFALYQATEITHLFGRVNELNARLTSLALRLGGVPNSRAGSSLLLPSKVFDVISECSAVYVAILYAAAVLAFPTAWRARLRGLAYGLVILFGANLLRLVTLGELLQRRPAWMPFFHEYLWQVLFILLVAALYVAWIERTVPRARARPAA